MTDAQPIVCKPTPWFLMRAVVILVMFSVFACLFYRDGSTGYRKKNLVYFLHAAFKRANDDFTRMDAGGLLTAEEWKSHAVRQNVLLPDQPEILPGGLAQPMSWPDVLHDYQRMKPLEWHKLWLEYSKAQGMDGNPPEKPYDARKINEQWVVFYVCVSLVAGTAFFLLRTIRRSIRADADGVTGANGTFVRYADMKRLDLRKWETKGLAFVEFESPGSSGTLRIDGLTYGGFKLDQGEPAEKLMRTLRSHFSGEILEYVSVLDGDKDEEAGGQSGGQA